MGIVYNNASNVTVASNQIIIGNNIASGNTDGVINIGNVFYGYQSNKTIGLGTPGGGNCWINTPVGTTQYAPLRLNAGSLLTTPGNGCIEFDGTHLYITIGGTRKTIV